MGKYASGELGISAPGLGFHLAPILGGVGGNPVDAEAVSKPDPMNAFPSGRFDKTEDKAGTSDAATATGATSARGATADEFCGTSSLVSGEGREARAGEASKSVER